MKKLRPFSFLRFTFLSLLFIPSLQMLFAQHAADPDTIIGMGAFNQTVASIAIQSDEKIIVGGAFTYFKGTPTNGIARLNKNGTLDKTFNQGGAGADADVVGTAIQSDGKIIVIGYFSNYNGEAANKIVRLNADGSIDHTFNVGASIDTYDYFLSITLQPDHKILLTGSLTIFNHSTVSGVIRLNTDGSLDNTFNTNLLASDLIHGQMNVAALQSDGKIVIGGDGDSAFQGIARLNADGTLDNSFTIIAGFQGTVTGIGIQSDDKIIVGGAIGNASQTLYYYNLLVLNADGTLNGRCELGFVDRPDIHCLTVQSDDKIIVSGSFDTYPDSYTEQGLVRLNSDGSLDTTFNYLLEDLPPQYIAAVAIQTDGEILVGGAQDVLSTPINNITRLNSNGRVDFSFYLISGAYDVISASAVQSDGKIIIVGDFYSYRNKIITSNVVRINTDGTIDETFVIPSGITSGLNVVTIQADGKIILAGSTNLNDTPISGIIRLNTDGALDNTFHTGGGISYQGKVNCIALQPDGKILVGGNFTGYDVTPCYNIARLNSDGSYDNSFSTGSGFNQEVLSLGLQSDHKILVGGSFITFDGNSNSYFVRLNSDGSYDNSFVHGSGADEDVLAITIQSDNRILIGGFFETYNGTACNGLARLNADGTLDPTFSVVGPTDGYGYVRTILSQPDGKIIIGGFFELYNGESIHSLARLNTDGSLDHSFNGGSGIDAAPYTDGGVVTASFLSNGKILVTGAFHHYQDKVFNNMVVLEGEMGDAITTAVASSNASNKTEAKIYPNPTNGLLHIEIPSNGKDTKISFLNTLGIVQKEIALNNTLLNQVNISDLKQGMYIYTIAQDGESVGEGLVQKW